MNRTFLKLSYVCVPCIIVRLRTIDRTPRTFHSTPYYNFGTWYVFWNNFINILLIVRPVLQFCVHTCCTWGAALISMILAFFCFCEVWRHIVVVIAVLRSTRIKSGRTGESIFSRVLVCGAFFLLLFRLFRCLRTFCIFLTRCSTSDLICFCDIKP